MGQISRSHLLLLRRHKYMAPMLWQVHNTNEWHLLSIFEITLQLAVLFIFLKLGTTDFFSSRF